MASSNIISFTDINGISKEISAITVFRVIDYTDKRTIETFKPTERYEAVDSLSAIKSEAESLFNATEDGVPILLTSVILVRLEENGSGTNIFYQGGERISVDEDLATIKDRISSTVPSSAVWGSITGDILNQLDLPSILSEGIWDYSSNTTIENPSIGNVRLNSSDLSLSNKAAISKTSNQGVDFSGLFSLLSNGAILNLREYSDVGSFIVSTITNVIDQGSWVEADYEVVDASSFSSDGVDTIIRILSLGNSLSRESRLPLQTLDKQGYYNLIVDGDYDIEDALITYDNVGVFQMVVYNNSGGNCVLNAKGSTVFEFLGDSTTQITLLNGEEITFTAVSTNQYNIG